MRKVIQISSITEDPETEIVILNLLRRIDPLQSSEGL